MRAEAEEVREDLENDGWIMLTDKWGYTHERQLTPSRMTIWVWDNWGRTFERMLEEIEGGN